MSMPLAERRRLAGPRESSQTFKSSGVDEVKRSAMRIGVSVMAAALAGAACDSGFTAPRGALSPEARRDAIRHGSVWSPTHILSVDFRAGPEMEAALAPDQWISCVYKEVEMNGQSPKFTCETSPGQPIKVKYGPGNAEVFGEVLGSRLLWGLGFAADRMFPVRVRCHGCPADPKHHPEPTTLTHQFDPAVVEQRLPGRTMETSENSGWEWSELDDIGPDSPVDARVHRDALKLLAAFIQHSDSKPSNQRILCPPGQDVGTTGCRAPVLLIQDLGITFGEATALNKNRNAVSLVGWSNVPVWKDPAKCVADLSGSLTGRFMNPQIGEAGRAFLAGLLIQLTDAQLRDLFEVSRVTLRPIDPSEDPDGPRATVEQWVEAFKRKRAQIVEHRCPQ